MPGGMPGSEHLAGYAPLIKLIEEKSKQGAPDRCYLRCTGAGSWRTWILER